MPAQTPFSSTTSEIPLIVTGTPAGTSSVSKPKPHAAGDDQTKPLNNASEFLENQVIMPRKAFFGDLVSTSFPLAVVDFIACVASLLFVIGAIAYYHAGVTQLTSQIAISMVGLIIMMFAYRLYPGVGMHPVYEFRQCLMAVGAAFVMATCVSITYKSSIAILMVFPILAVLIPGMRSLARSLLAGQEWWGVRCLVFCAGQRVDRLFKRHVGSISAGFRPIGYIQDQADSVDEVVSGFYLGNLEVIEQRVQESGCQVAIVHRCGRPDHEIAAFVDKHLRVFSKVVIVPDDERLPSLWAMGRHGGTVIIDRLQVPINQFIKRAMDISISLTSLVLGAPLLLSIAVWVKVTSPGPLFFGHERIGKNGRRFKAWKFRSMCVNADEVLNQTLAENPAMREEWEATQKLKNDPRVSSSGRFLRKTSLDELPQLWNVLVGDMSLVGPRPIVKSEIEKYNGTFKTYLRVRPGVTGFWQISGRNLTTYERRVELDDYYVRNWSPWFDLYILVRTVRTVLFREGAF